MDPGSGIGLPERFEIADEGGDFRIGWKWPRLIALPLAVFSVAWDGFLLFWYSQMLGRNDVPWIAIVFPIGHVAVGLVLPYVALAFWMNRTVVSVTGGDIRVAHRPVPFPGNRRIQATDLRQLFCVTRRGRRDTASYALMARLASGREVTLISGLSNDREARFLEERIEQRLGLGNEAVAGELQR
jgi:hypothetical protein